MSLIFIKKRENCAKCPCFEEMEVNYKLLKENYERLITINKNVQAQAKDKKYVQDVLLLSYELAMTQLKQKLSN